MTTFSLPHICLLVATIAFLALTAFLVSKLPRRWQTGSFWVAAFLCAGGIFFRYAMNLSLHGGLRLDALAIQMLQVCNFNFVLVFLMLIPKFELARQYSVFFSLFAACTTFITVPSRYASCPWYDTGFINFWLNHLFAVAVPVWMMAARRLKPKKEYVIKVSLCVVAYFTLSFLITLWLKGVGVLPAEASFSYIFNTSNIFVLDFLYTIIPVPLLYLLPLLPLLFAFFCGLAWLFRKYEVKGFSSKNNKIKETSDQPPTPPKNN